MSYKKIKSDIQMSWVPPENDSSEKIARPYCDIPSWVIQYRIEALCEKEKNEGIQEGYEFALIELARLMGLDSKDTKLTPEKLCKFKKRKRKYHHKH